MSWEEKHPIVYVRGYGNKEEERDIRALMEDTNIHLFDTRKSNRTGYIAYDGPELERVYGDRYHVCGALLGNENYKERGTGMPHKITDLDRGTVGIIRYLYGGYEELGRVNAIVMCGCSTIVEHMAVALCECPTGNPCERCIPLRGKAGCHVNTIIQRLHKLRPMVVIEYMIPEEDTRPVAVQKKAKFEYANPLF